MQGQGIVNNWDFPSKISRHCHKRLVQKFVVSNDQRDMFVKMSLLNQADCLVDFVGMTLFCFPPLSICFFRFCFPTLFAAVLKDFLPLIPSPISGAANSNMAAPMRFAAGTPYLRKKGSAVLPISCARAPNPFLSVFQPLSRMDSLLVLKQPSCKTVCVRNERWTSF